MVIATKRNFFRSIATKKLPSSVARGVKKIGNFALGQLKHPAVGNFIRDQAGILAATGFNPEVAAPAMAARAGQEAIDVVGRTINNLAR